MPSGPIKTFSFLFYLQITSGTHRRAKRGTHRHAKRERERERRTHRRSGTVERERERERERKERVGRVSSGPTLDAAARSHRRVRDAKFSVRAADLSLSRSPSPFWTGSDRHWSLSRQSAFSPITLSWIYSLADLLDLFDLWFFFFFFFVVVWVVAFWWFLCCVVMGFVI